MEAADHHRFVSEQEEAAIWQKLAMCDDPFEVEALKREHGIAFSLLGALELECSNRCTACKTTANFQCTKCGETYCGLTCQKADWPAHKKYCGKEAEIQKSFAAAFLKEPRIEGKFSVVITYKRSQLHLVQMSREQMMSFPLFIEAIQTKIPDFHPAMDFGWQHWQSVREAFNPYR